MKNSKLFCFLVTILFFSFLNAQKPDLNRDVLAELISAHINKLRSKLGKLPLKRDVDLASAAKLHSDYIAKK